MTENCNQALVFAACLTAAALIAAVGCEDREARQAAIDKAHAQVNRIAEDLDKRTTETGVYVRVKENEIKENDRWGTRIKVSYSQGGVAETVSVRSAGPDREFHTDDDIVAQGMTANLKGVGEGIKKNIGEAAENVARETVKGAIGGMKDSIKSSWPLKKKGDDRKPKADDEQHMDPKQKHAHEK